MSILKPPSEEIARRIIYILYAAWVDARAYSEDHQRVFELADAMHNAPALLVNCDEYWLRCFREDLVRYETKYSPTRSYVNYLDNGVPDYSEWLWLDYGD